MFDASLEDEIVPSKNYTATTTSTNALSSIQTQLATFKAPVAQTDYDSFGDDYFTTMSCTAASTTAMTMATNLDSADCDSLEDYRTLYASLTTPISAPVVTTATTTTTTAVTNPALKPLSVVLSEPEPSYITSLKCQVSKTRKNTDTSKLVPYDDTTSKKERKKEKKKEKKKDKKKKEEEDMDIMTDLPVPSFKPKLNISVSLPELIPLKKEQPFGSRATPLPKLTPLKKEPSFGGNLPELIPINASQPISLPKLIPLKKEPFSTASLESNSEKKVLERPLPALIPFEKKVKSESFRATLMGNVPLNANQLPPLIPLQRTKSLQSEQRSSLNTISHMAGASFFGSQCATASFGASAGAKTKFDLGCAFEGQPLLCPVSYVEKKRPDLYETWLDYNAVPLVTDNMRVVIILQSGMAIGKAIEHYENNEPLIRNYLRSHIVRLDENDSLRPELAGKRVYRTDMKGFDLIIDSNGDSYSLRFGDEVIDLVKTENTQVLRLMGDRDFYPAETDSDMLTLTMPMEGILGNIKKKALHKTGVKKQVKPRKYEDLEYQGVAVDSKTVFGVTGEGDPIATTRVKVDVYASVDRGINKSINMNKGKPMTVFNGDVSMARNGSVKEEPFAYSYVFRMNGKGVTLASLYDKGVVINLSNTRPSVLVKKSSKTDSGFAKSRIPAVFKDTPLQYAFDKTSRTAVENDISADDSGSSFFMFGAKKVRGILPGSQQLIFRRNGPGNTLAALELYYLIIRMAKEDLAAGIDYATAFVEFGAPMADELDGDQMYLDGRVKDEAIRMKEAAKKTLRQVRVLPPSKSTTQSRLYTELVLDPTKRTKKTWPLSDADALYEFTERHTRDANPVTIQWTEYDGVDRMKKTLDTKGRNSVEFTDLPVEVSRYNGVEHYTIAILRSDQVKLDSATRNKGFTITLKSAALPASLRDRTFHFAFESALKSLESKERYDKAVKDEMLTYKGDNPAEPFVFYFGYEKIACELNSLVSAIGCRYTLVYLNIVARAATPVFKSAFEECLYHEALQQGNGLSTALSHIEEENEFNDFQSMNGAVKLIGALSSIVNERRVGMPLSSVDTTTSTGVYHEHDKNGLHTTLYEMNRDCLPLKKNEVKSRAMDLFNNLLVHTQFESMSVDKQAQTLASLSGTLDTLGQSLSNIDV